MSEAIWLPLLFVAVLLAVVLVALVPPDEASRWRWARPRGQRTAVDPVDPADVTALAAEPGRRLAQVGLALWVVVIAAVVALVLAALV